MPGARRGYVNVLVAASCFGTLGTFSKLFYDEGGEAFALLFLRFAIGGPLILLLALAARERFPRGWLAFVCASLGVLQFGVAIALFEGFERAPVALVTLLYFAYPLVTAVGAALLFREELGLGRVLILLVALAGVALTIGFPESADWLGIALGLVAGLCVAGLILSSRALMSTGTVTPLALAALMFTSPAVGLALAAPATAPELDLSASAWGWAAATVLVATVLPIPLFYNGVRQAGASAAGLLSTAEPLVSVLLAYAVLGESLTALQLAGGALIVVSVFALALERSTRVRA